MRIIKEMYEQLYREESDIKEVETKINASLQALNHRRADLERKKGELRLLESMTASRSTVMDGSKKAVHSAGAALADLRASVEPKPLTKNLY